jgi:hypothetical protein
MCGDRHGAAGGGPPRLEHLDGYVHAVDLGAVHGLLGGPRVLLAPEFDYRDVRAEAGLRAHGRECAEGTEEVEELRIVVVRRQLLDDAGKRRRRREWRRRVCWWPRGEDERDGRQGVWDGTTLKGGEGLFGCMMGKCVSWLSKRRVRMEDGPLSKNLNSIVPDKGLCEPFLGMMGLKGAQLAKAAASISSVM